MIMHQKRNPILNIHLFIQLSCQKVKFPIALAMLFIRADTILGMILKTVLTASYTIGQPFICYISFGCLFI